MNEIINIINLAKIGYVPRVNFSITESIRFTIKLFLILIISSLFIIVLMQLVNYYLIELPKPNKLNRLNNLPTLELFFKGVVFAPIIEELIFRLCLKFSKLNFSIMIASFIFLISNMFFEFSNIYMGIIVLLIAVALFFILNDRVIMSLNKFWMKKKLFIFYFSLIAFAYFHLANHDNITLKIIILSPIILATKFVGGFIMSYARLKSGIISSIVLHMLNNSIAFILLTYPMFL